MQHCYLGFLELLTTKYKGLDRLDVVAPTWLMEHMITRQSFVRRAVDPHFTTISVVDPEHKTSYLAKGVRGGPTLVLRFDVLPLLLAKMAGLYANSLPHALLTGDQSITDFLHFRRDKPSVPYYQGVPWKQSFYTHMARELPQKYYASKRTSCGDLTAVKYKPNLAGFVRRNSFATNAKRLIQAVVFSVADTSTTMVAYKAAVLRARNSVHSARRNVDAAFDV